MSLTLGTLAFLAATLFAQRLCRPGSSLYVLDHPNSRSLHETPTPRSGGLAIFLTIAIFGTIAAVFYGAGSEILWLGVAVLMIAAVSFIDDWLTIRRVYRIVAHFFSAYLIIRQGLTLEHLPLPGVVWAFPEPVLIVLSLLFVVWMTNLYNFMDGMDGFAAGMAVVGFGSFAALGWLSDQQLFAALNLIIAAAAGGFLIFNFPPASIFMGDLGSSVLGVLASAFMLWANSDGIFPIWIGILIFSPFIVDATVTLLRRILRGEKFLQAHKTHYYQRLVQLGWGHKRTVLLQYGVMLLSAVSAIFVVHSVAFVQWAVLVAWLLAYSLIIYFVHRLEARQGIRLP